jgi:hypothetical protein
MKDQVAANDTQSRSAFLGMDRRAIVLILVIKALVLIFGILVFLIVEGQPPTGILSVWTRWDAEQYIAIARDGYRATVADRFSLVFYPLFPWLIRLVALAVRDYPASAILVSTFASIAAGLLLWRLVRLDFADHIADKAVWFLFIFPTSYFLHIGYTESLFLALATGSFLMARRNKWGLAGVLGALACLTRANGVVLIPALAVEAMQQYRVNRRWNAGWVWIAFVMLGVGGYFLLNSYVTGDAFKFLVFQKENWHKSLDWPWVGIIGKFQTFPRLSPRMHIEVIQELFFVALGLVATIWSIAKLRAAYGVWMAGNWLLFVSTSLILSVPRYILVMFPLFIMFANLARRSAWKVVITLWSLGFLALFSIYFVRGAWAF